MLLILCVSHEHSATQKHANMLETNVKMQIRTPQVNDRNTSAGICPLEHRDKEIITYLQLPFLFVNCEFWMRTVERQQLTDGDQLRPHTMLVLKVHVRFGDTYRHLRASNFSRDHSNFAVRYKKISMLYCYPSLPCMTGGRSNWWYASPSLPPSPGTKARSARTGSCKVKRGRWRLKITLSPYNVDVTTSGTEESGIENSRRPWGGKSAPWHCSRDCVKRVTSIQRVNANRQGESLPKNIDFKFSEFSTLYIQLFRRIP